MALSSSISPQSKIFRGVPLGKDRNESRKYTRFEKARIIGARALQLAMGAPPLLEIPEGMSDPIEIALYEFENGAIPITVVRKYPSGRKELV